MKFLKRHPFVFAILLLIGTPAGLNYSGFCMSQGRWLSDEEKIRLAIKSLIQQDTVLIETPEKGTQQFKAVKYTEVDQFLNKNPNCCKTEIRVGDDFVPRNYFTAIAGKHADNIRIEYIANYLDQDNKIQSQKVKIVPLISNCGKVRFGMWH